MYLFCQCERAALSIDLNTKVQDVSQFVLKGQSTSQFYAAPVKFVSFDAIRAII